MTPRHPRDGDPLDREVDEALALANESPPRGPEPPGTEPDEDWADAALSLANGRPAQPTRERGPGEPDGPREPGQPDGPREPGETDGTGHTDDIDAIAGTGTDAPARTDWVETALDLAREAAGEPAAVLDAQGHVRRRPEVYSRSRSSGSPTSEGTGAKGTRSRAPAHQAPTPHPKRTPGASTPHPHPSMNAPHRSPTSWPDARAIAARAAVKEAAHTAPVMRPLTEALGQVLAAPLAALTDLPPFDTSAMDGWALSGPGPWRLPTGTKDQDHPGILAGHGETAPLPDGHAVRIATGARVPPGATAVLRSEYGTDAGDGWLHASPAHPVVLGQDIRTRGQECRSGDQLLPAGTLVTPAVLGLAAAAGYDELPTVRRPRVEVLVLGDELLTEGLPHDGRIRDALGPMVGPWLRALGAEVMGTRRLTDEADVVHAAVAESTADVVVTTGGTAAGPLDHVHPTLRRLGAELLVDGVAVRPGHPMLLARLARESPIKESPANQGNPGNTEPPERPARLARHLVGLPGNPLAAVSGLLTLAEPLLRTMTGRPAPDPGPAPLAEAVQGHPRDTRLVPVTFRQDAAVPLRFNGPAMLRGIAAADGLAVIPPGGAKRGTEVDVLDLPWSASAAEQPSHTEQARQRTDQSPQRPAQAPQRTDQAPQRPAQAPQRTDQAPQRPAQAPQRTDQAPQRPARASQRTDQAPQRTAQATDGEDISPQEGPA
ncbi:MULTISPECIES: molybdopterin molybdotransferase MoeA [Streptomyces violaceusniger group]|uniref:Molybdopterin molybdenumtransferase n=1 Tax=Streptomyces rhizosphaericus TaxID=114699 RepID=A0ABN1SK04_9ACTN|nr:MULTISPECIES: molybdopterin-binding protein [Streptomyces violaceusniger group]